MPDSDLFRYLVLPLLIFLSRILDVPLGTIRIMFVSKGKRVLAPLFGFFEVLIWIIAISQIMQHLDNPLTYVAYAGGFSLGNYIGIRIEEKIAIGIYMVRVILTQNDSGLMEHLAKEGFGVTKVNGFGANGPVSIIYTVIRRKDLDRVVEIIHKYSDKAFYSIEEARTAYAGVFPGKHGSKENKAINAIGETGEIIGEADSPSKVKKGLLSKAFINRK